MNKLWQAIGGRKFLLALVCIGVGTAIELETARGLSMNMAGLLAMILAAFNVSNVMATKDFLKNKAAAKPVVDTSAADAVTELSGELQYMSDKLDMQSEAITQVAQSAANTQNLLNQAIMAGQQYNQSQGGR